MNGRDEPGGHERVPAYLKKVVVNTDPLQPQHLGPELDQRLFQRIARRSVGFGQFRPDWLRCRQGLAVDFAVGSQRDFAKQDKCSRNHIIRQSLFKMASQFWGQLASKFDLQRVIGIGVPGTVGSWGGIKEGSRRLLDGSLAVRTGKYHLEVVFGAGGRPGDVGVIAEFSRQAPDILRLDACFRGDIDKLSNFSGAYRSFGAKHKSPRLDIGQQAGIGHMPQAQKRRLVLSQPLA